MINLLKFAIVVGAWIIALGWLWKALSAWRGLRAIPNLLRSEFDRIPHGKPRVTVIVPARNEAEAISSCLESLVTQDYDGLSIIAVDDRSTDITGAIMDGLSAHYPHRLRAIHIKTLPEGWLGKTHAMALAARDAIAMDQPDYLLFTDADVIFRSDAIRRSLFRAVETEAEHFVTFPTPIIKSAGEGMLLGYLGVMGLWATRPWKAADPKAIRDFIGIGAFNLVTTSAYQRLGGFDALRMEILEDLTLARRVKLVGLKQRVAVAPGMVSLHWAPGALGVVNVMTKNLFSVFRFRLEFVFAACCWIALFCLGPFIFIALRETRVPAVMTLLSIVLLYIVSKRHSRIAAIYVVLFPIAALVFLYSILKSVLTTLRTGGVTWRGTFYRLADLRRAAQESSKRRAIFE